MRDELWENTRLHDKTFPINVFHNKPAGSQVLRLHWHEHFEIINVIKGNVTFQIGNNRIQAEPGSILFVNSEELHMGFTEYDQLVEFYAIVFHPTLLGNTDSHVMESLVPYTSGKRLISNFIDSRHDLYPSIEQAVNSIIQEFNHKHQGYELIVKGFCQLLFIWLTRSHSVGSSSKRQLVAWQTRAERFKDLLTYVEQNYTEPISIKQAAAMVHLSPYHFCSAFKKLTSLTFVQYINLHRIYEAELLLQQTSLTITETAERVGCGSVHSFNKLFRKYKGISPSAFRKEYYDRN